jgi:hypothetical protein
MSGINLRNNDLDYHNISICSTIEEYLTSLVNFKRPRDGKLVIPDSQLFWLGMVCPVENGFFTWVQTQAFFTLILMQKYG